MIALLAGAASAEGPDASTLDHIAAVEWARGEPVQLRAQLAGADTATRVAAVRALGRLRSEGALEDLVAYRDDPALEVRVAVAEVLGWTPRGAEVLRPWWRERAAEPATLSAAVAVALGRAGDVRDVQSLIAALPERGAVGTAAARALGTFGTRGLTGLELAVPPLVAQLDTLDGERVDAVAWALARLRQPLPAAHVPEVLRALDAGPSPEARAWLYKASWTSLPREERDERFLVAMTDAPRLVQVAILSALEPEDAEPVVLAGFLADRDPWVRLGVLEALGRHPDDTRVEVLEQHLASTTDPWEQAATVRALRRSDPERAADATQPVVVRAAWVELLADANLLVRYASEAPEPAVRSAAAGAWSEREPLPAHVEKLLAASDPAVRQVATERAGVLAPKVALPLLRTSLATEAEPAVKALGWATFHALLSKDPRALPARDAKTKALVAAFGAGDAPTVAHVTAIAKALALPPPAATVEAAPAPHRPAELAATRKVRSARVFTDHGEFVIGLDPDRAPLAVATFAGLAEADFFDGQVFHRVVPGFVAQTGCPRGDGWGGPGFVLPDEDSEVPFDVGSVGMARELARDTGGSQWFVTTSDQPHLTSEYTRFGRVVQGLHVVQGLPPGAVVRDVVIERLP